MTARVQLRTERLLLRPFEAGDAPDLVAYRDDPEFARFLSHVPQPFRLRDAEAMVALNMSESWETSPTFAIVLGGKVIGTVNFEVDRETRAAMLGYAIAREHWGRGIVVEAARAALAWAVDAYRLISVWASTDVRHVRSQRVMEKLGMKRERVLPDHHRGRDGEPIDEVRYGLDLAPPK